MIAHPATHYVRFISNLTPTLIEGGQPIIVQGVVFSDVTHNAQLAFYERDGLTPIMLTYVANVFGDNPTNEFIAPFLAQNGLSIFSYETFLTDTTTDVDITVFYSLIGA